MNLQHLDPSGREEVMKTVKQLNEEMGITVIHITHFMDEALYADRVIVMDKGEIAIVGTPREVFSQWQDMAQLGLEVPPVGQLSRRLWSAGIDIDPGILTVDELVDELCRLKSRIDPYVHERTMSEVTYIRHQFQDRRR